jgi:nucleoid-associated protein YgaU
MVNPLYIYVGLAAASLGGLMALSHERWEHWPNSAEQVVGKVGTAAPGQPEPASPSPPAPAPSASAPAPSAPASGAATPAAPAASAEVKPAEPVQSADPSAQKSGLEQDLAALGLSEAKPAAPGAAAVEKPEKPSFDIVRVDPEGQAVVAGRSEPGWHVDVKINGETKGKAVANERGEWVWVTKDPIDPGSSEITLEARREPSAPALNSDQAVDVVVSGTPGKQALVVLSEASRPSKVMQSPEEQLQPGAPKVALALPGETAPAAASKVAPAGAKRPVTLDVVDYDDGGEIIFSGRGSPGATVRLYVDNKPVGDAPVDGKGGWTLSGNGRVAPGQHALRVDELGPGAKVESRVELPFVRAKPAEVAALDRDSKTSPPAQPVQPAQPEAAVPPAAAAAGTVESEPEATPKSDKLADETVPPAAPSGAAATAQPPADSPAEVTPPVTSLAEVPPKAETPSQPTAQQPMGKEQAVAGLPEAAPGSPDASRPRKGRVVIQPGNNLWNISRVIYGKGTRFTVIYQANKELIRNPRLIYPGQIFATPGSVQPEAIDPKWRKPLAEISGDETTPN